MIKFDSCSSPSLGRSCQEIAGKSLHRRLTLFRRLGLFGQDTHGAVIRRASSIEDLVAAYQLTHDLFVEQGYIKPLPSGVRVRAFEMLPETGTMIATLPRGVVVGVTSVVIDQEPIGLPCEKAFGQEVEHLRSQGRKVCEGTNWLVHPDFRRSAVLGELMRAALAQAVHKQCDDMLACVSPGHQSFYEVIGFEKIGEERSYSARILDPVVLMRLQSGDLRAAYAGENEKFNCEYWIDGNPYHQRVGEWSRQAEKEFRSPALLRDLFISRTDFLRTLMLDHPEHVDAIRRAWGTSLFERVLQGHPVRL